MTSKERVAAALNFEESDRVPVSALFVPEMQEELRKYLNINANSDKNSAALAGDLMNCIGTALGNDMVKVQVGMENMFYVPGDEEYVTNWGVNLMVFEVVEVGIFGAAFSHGICRFYQIITKVTVA